MEEHPILEPADTPPAEQEPIHSPDPRPSRGPMPLLIGIGVLLVAVIALQVYTLAQTRQTAADVADVASALTDLDTGLALVEGSVNEVSDRVAAIESVGASGGQSTAAAVPAGYLPRYQSGQTDTALGRSLPAVTGFEYYAQTDRTFETSDGKNRVWMIWAHWCPYCQQELPSLSEWYTSFAGAYPSTELVTVTTSIDDSRANPLIPYLDESSFSFPVLVDEDLDLAARFGTSAFPFWVVTDGDGTVLFRTAGLLGIETVESIFSQLETGA